MAKFISSQLQEDRSSPKRRKVLACVVIPDYSKLLTYEIQRAELISGFKIMRNNQRRFMNCIVPKAFLNEKDYQIKMRNVEFQVDKQITRNQVSSQTAFLALDSLSSVLKLKAKFK